MHFADWGLIEYGEAWQKQEAVFNSLIQAKQENRENAGLETIVFCEHPHVYTLGKQGKPNNLLVNDDFLKKIRASYFHIDRGGDITYHGPGQLVGYPIIDLENHTFLLKEYIHKLEEAIIETIGKFGLKGERLEGASGVWLDAQAPDSRKICAIGVRASRFVTMHGFALNVNTDLNYYTYINPCGFVDRGVTSMQKELNRPVDIEEVKEVLRIKLVGLLQ